MRKNNVLRILLPIILIVVILSFLASAKSFNVSNDDESQCRNAKEPLALINAYGDTQATHPKAVAFNEKWNGYKYWITFTPYCNGDDRTENPHILASNDLINWEEPTGYTNPLDPEPEDYKARICYNSDSHLVYNNELDRLECWWRYVNDDKDQVIIFRKWTTDGVNWSEKEMIQENHRSVDDYVSPAVIFEDGIYKIWTIGNGYKLRYWESLDGKDWQLRWEQAVSYADSNLRSWHVDVIHTDNGYEAVIVAFDKTIKQNSHQKMSLYYLKSDNNYDYTEAEVLLRPTNGTDQWDNWGIYRSALMYSEGTYYLFYSGIKTTENRQVGLIRGQDVFEMD